MASGDRYRAMGPGPNGWGTYDVAWTNGLCDWTPSSGQSEVLLVPGFVDIHIHGAFGIDFMSARTPELLRLCEKLGEIGYEAFLPTTVSAGARDVAGALSRMPDHPMILGFHLEGPFISPEYPGAQPPEAILDPLNLPGEWDAILDDPRLRVATLAPERPGALELTRRLSGRGVIVSMGHTAATFEQAQGAYEAGARHTTHAFDAMRGLHHREAGMVGFALIGGVECELIYDRLHVSKEAAQVLMKCKTAEHVIAVSDGTMASGLGDGKRLAMWSHAAETRNGGVYLAGTNTLAGSAITLLDAFRNLAADFGEEAAVKLCSLNPRRAMAIGMPPRVYVEFDQQKDLVGIRKKAHP